MALTIDLNDNADYRLSFSTLQSLRNLEDKTFPVTAALQASISVVEHLRGVKFSVPSLEGEVLYPVMQTRLIFALDCLRGDLISAETLRDRITGIIHLVGSPGPKHSTLY